ncbi:uncharacterized protein LOC113351428 [Papaver somniferum]|uniref:uncharacterized protein LOC113351428 n=1 Tax=Papaver somniferum TaxID=3469 RepID=UPI000E6FBE1F|nr:uncharacterized protein LOC113351428 [Papaver somniferum]
MSSSISYSGRSDSGIVNPSYVAWCDGDNTLILWLQSTIFDFVVFYVVIVESARELRCSIESRFDHTSTKHVIQIHTKLQTLKLGSGPMATYLGEIKKLTNQLSVSGSEISNDELMVLVLNGIGQEYNSFSTSICVKNPPIYFDELHNLLLCEEVFVSERSKPLFSETNNNLLLFNLNKYFLLIREL